MARRTKEDTEKTFHALLDAATKVFNEHGITKTTLNEIAETAGMTRGAVYWHFKNKDAVIKALWERSTGTETAQFICSISQIPNQEPLSFFRQKLKTILNRAINDADLNQSLRIITSSMEFTNEDSELQKYLRSERERIYKRFYTAIEKLQSLKVFTPSLETDVVATSFWVFMTGLLRTHIEMKSSKVNITKHYEQLVDLWVNSFQLCPS